MAKYVDVKQNGKHLLDVNKFTYKKVHRNTSRNISRDQRKHDLKNLVAQFESMSTKLFMDSLIVDFYNDIS